eukprot:Gb_36290 [translate_table: standard]
MEAIPLATCPISSKAHPRTSRGAARRQRIGVRQTPKRLPAPPRGGHGQMAVESYLVFPFENLFQDIINHADDFGDLDKEMLDAPFSADFRNDDISSACSEEAQKQEHGDHVSHNNDNPKRRLASAQTLAATQRLNCVPMKYEKPNFVHVLKPQVDSESCILIESPSPNGDMPVKFSSLYLNSAVPDSHPPSLTQLATSLEQAASLAPPRISLSNGLLSYASEQTQDLAMPMPMAMGNSISGVNESSADCMSSPSAIAAQVSSPANSSLVTSGSIDESNAVEELILEDKNVSMVKGSQFNSTRISGSSIDHVDFVSKADAAGDSLSPLPTYMQRTSSILERSLSSHALGQLMPLPRVNDQAPMFPQFSAMHHGLPSPDTKLHQQLKELQGLNNRPAFTSMRRVYSTGDIQTVNEMPLGHGCGSPLTSEHSSYEDAGFKVGRYSVEERKQRIYRYKKKRTERNFNKKIKVDLISLAWKTLADSRPRVRGRFAKNDDSGDNTSKASGGHADEDDEEEVRVYAVHKFTTCSVVFLREDASDILLELQHQSVNHTLLQYTEVCLVDHVQEEEEHYFRAGNPTNLLNRMNVMTPIKAKHNFSFGF